MAKKRSTLNRGLPVPGAKPTAPRMLIADLRELIEATCAGVAQAVNSALVLLYWQVGHRIRTEILRSRRAAYGQEILSTVSKEMVASYGNGFSVPNLSRMTRLAELYPDREVVAALAR